MKLNYKPFLSLLLGVLCGSAVSHAQITQTITLNPSTTEVQDAPVSLLNPNSNFGSLNEMHVYSWTVQGTLNINRVLLNFDLSALPLQSSILDARMILYYKPSNGGFLTEHSGQNNYVVQRVISEWKEGTVTWNTQPSVTNQNMVEVPPTASPFQNTVIDVTGLVQDMVDDPLNSYGFMLRFAEEIPYKVCLYASGDHPDISLHPELIVTYLHTTGVEETGMERQIHIYPNPSNALIHIDHTGATPVSVIRVQNMLGQLIGEFPGTATQLELTQKGFFLLDFHTSEGIVTKKVLIQ